MYGDITDIQVFIEQILKLDNVLYLRYLACSDIGKVRVEIEDMLEQHEIAHQDQEYYGEDGLTHLDIGFRYVLQFREIAKFRRAIIQAAQENTNGVSIRLSEETCKDVSSVTTACQNIITLLRQYPFNSDTISFHRKTVESCQAAWNTTLYPIMMHTLLSATLYATTNTNIQNVLDETMVLIQAIAFPTGITPDLLVTTVGEERTCTQIFKQRFTQ